MKWFAVTFLTMSVLFLSVFSVDCFYGYLFPTKYSAEIEEVCNESGVSKSLVFSMINVESGFDKKAKSSKGAVGLMQVMPNTANETAERLGLENYDLFDAYTNIKIGVNYFAFLEKKFKDQNVALCAYNAGPTNVLSWLGDKKCSDDGKTLKSIPFKETENYIKKINKNLKYYSKK